VKRARAIRQKEQPELRTVLGADAFQILQASYTKSLQSLVSQQEISVSVAIEGKTGFIPE